jgi:hypothetical protein
MAYIVVEADGPVKQELSQREVDILQMTFLNLAAMTNALITGQGVMLNPPDEGKLGITFAFPEKITAQQEEQLKEQFITKLNTFFKMSKLDLTAEIVNLVTSENK